MRRFAFVTSGTVAAISFAGVIYMLMVVFLLGIALLMLLIIKFKINPFLALIFTAIVIGFSAGLPVQKMVGSIASAEQWAA